MQKPSALLLTTLISVSIITLTHEGMAATSAAASKMGTRLITLGTSAGPIPRSHRAQSSNLLTVNGVHNVVVFLAPAMPSLNLRKAPICWLYCVKK